MVAMNSPYDSRWGLLGDASQWAIRAANYGLKVSKQPSYGAIAQWNFGHVAYVEQVHYNSAGVIDSFEVTDDNYNRQVTTHKVIYVGVSAGDITYPDNFITFPAYSGGGGSSKPPVALGPTPVSTN